MAGEGNTARLGCSPNVYLRVSAPAASTRPAFGWVSEWLKEPVSKTGMPARASWFRIPPYPWRGGRAVEGAGLENRNARKRIVGSNPTLSVQKTGSQLPDAKLPKTLLADMNYAAAARALRAADPKFHSLIERVGPCRIELGHMQSPFQALAESIVYQQLTGKAAATIHGRLVSLFPRKRITPERLLETHPRRLRGAGLSRAKVK